MVRRPQIAPAPPNFLLCLALILIYCGSVVSGRGQSAVDTAPETGQPVASQVPPSEPIGANRCLSCHPAEVEGYARTAMAHSLRRAGNEPEGTVSAQGSTITMHSLPTGYWQHWENAGDSSDYRVDFVIGSGTHASGYLVDVDGHLFQSPVAFYTRRQAYDLAPGYENLPDPDFTRPVSEECVLCHSGNALHVVGTLNQYRSPVFSADGITCERCHGPAEKHLADPRAGTIVNPAKLEPAARDSVCEQCHLFGVARVPNPGKQLSDFVPGQRLEDAFTIYHNAVPPGSPAGAFKVISHAEQLALSACARNSGGKLWCGTCHDPHNEPEQPVQYYRAKCLTCHATNFPVSPHPTISSDCLGCHMPRRDAQDGGHTVFTDHRIQKRPVEEPDLPPGTGIVAWREPAGDLQRRNLGIADIDVGMQRRSTSLVVQGYLALTDVQQQFTNDPEFFKWIGDALLAGKQLSDAKFALDRASQLDPDSAVAEASAAGPYIEAGDNEAAIPYLERAVALDPLYLPAATTLIDLYEKQGRTADAAALSNKVKAAMIQTPAVDQTAQNGSSGDSSKSAQEVFKNIQVLKGVPSGQLIPAMQFISSSLGVECSYCHVDGHFEKDDKKPKQTARLMMQMMFDLNKNNFAGQREVTCYSCHRGAPSPVADPDVAGQMQSSAAASAVSALPANLPTVAQLLDNYVTALGGATALEKITSRVEKGTVDVRGQSVNVDIYTEAPNKQAVVQHFPDGDNLEVFDGQAGWSVFAGRAIRSMDIDDIEVAQMNADLQFPLRVRQIFTEIHVEYPEKIDDRDFYVLSCAKEGQPAAKFYFDEQSNLLVRVVRYSESPLGLDPTLIDYADYRDVDGVQVPFRVTRSRPESSSTIQIEEVHQNVLIDNSKFLRPSSGPKTGEEINPRD
jgi:photosynthetic reaction center cytochrome c subunit